MVSSQTRKSYTAEFKLELIQYAEKNGNRATERAFGVGEKLVRDWRKAKNSLLSMKRTKKANRGQKSRWPDLEDLLCQFIIGQKAQGLGVSMVQVQLKAKDISRELGIEDFQGSSAWCSRFLHRHHLSLKVKKPTDQQVPVSYGNFYGSVSSETQNYSVMPGDVFGIDEVPLTFNIPLGRTVDQKEEITVIAKTTEDEKSQVTLVLACFNDSNKVQPLKILKTMPYKASSPSVVDSVDKKDRMDEDAIMLWLENYFRESPVSILKHSTKGPLENFMCRRKFSKSSSLKYLRKGLTGIKPFKHKVCDRAVSQHSSLENYLRNHAVNKEHKRRIFGKSLLHSPILQNRRRTNTGEKPYKCPVCDNLFSQSSTLKYHLTTHTAYSGALDLECHSDTCSQNELLSSETKSIESCSPGTTFSNHLLEFCEAAFGCGVCDAMFNVKSAFMEHCSQHSSLCYDPWIEINDALDCFC